MKYIATIIFLILLPVTTGASRFDWSFGIPIVTDDNTASTRYDWSFGLPVITVTPSATSTPPVEDTCTYSGTGNWNVNYSDNCYVTSETYVLGDCNIIYDGAGSFNLQANLICDELNAGAGAAIFAENSTAQIEIY